MAASAVILSGLTPGWVFGGYFGVAFLVTKNKMLPLRDSVPPKEIMVSEMENRAWMNGAPWERSE